MASAFAKKRSIDAEEAPPGTALTEVEAQLMVELDNYLDFFGLIWHLVDSKQLDETDAYWLFSWYLTTGLEGIGVIFDDVTGEYTEFQDMRRLYDRFHTMDAETGAVAQEEVTQGSAPPVS